MSNRMTIESAEAKLISSLSNLFFIIPALFAIELYLSSLGDYVPSLNGDAVASILKGILWLLFAFRLTSVVTTQLDKNREHTIKMIKLKETQKKYNDRNSN